MKARKYSIVAGAAIATMLAACGDEVTEVTERAELGSVEKYKDLETCDESSVGKMVFAEDSNAIFTCTKNGWLSLNGADGAKGEDGADGTSCSASKLKDGTGVEVKCGGKVVGTIKNGDKGDAGDPGENGEAGKSCTAEVLEDGSGIEVSCDGEVVGTLENGKSAYELSGSKLTQAEWIASLKGEKGDPGAAGSCTAKENKAKNGYDITCGETTFTISNGAAGAAGTSCTATKVTEGVKVQCGEDDEGVVIKNGSDGKNFDDSWMIDPRDKQIYKTVKIGDKVWMAQSLNYATTVGNSYCKGENEEEQTDFCTTYGRLYSWAAAVGKTEAQCGDGYECDLGTGDIQGVCPEGWHLPSKTELQDLIVTVDGNIDEYVPYHGISNVAGKKLKSKTGWTAEGSVPNEDTYSFAALPAGIYNGSKFQLQGENVAFYSSTQFDENKAWYIILYHKHGEAYVFNHYKNSAYSVRCVKN